MGAEQVGRLLLEEILHHRLADRLGHRAQQGIEIVALELALAHHAADQLVVQPVGALPWVGGERLGEDGAGSFLEAGQVGRVEQIKLPAELAWARFAEIDHQITFGDFFSHVSGYKIFAPYQ